jgi:hypothetical protein
LTGAAALDPPDAVEPPNAAVSAARAATAATNQNRFTDILLLVTVSDPQPVRPTDQRVISDA